MYIRDQITYWLSSVKVYMAAVCTAWSLRAHLGIAGQRHSAFKNDSSLGGIVRASLTVGVFTDGWKKLCCTRAVLPPDTSWPFYPLATIQQVIRPLPCYLHCECQRLRSFFQ